MKTLMRNGRDRRSENPFLGHARKERVSLFGTDQRITSGPAATRLHSKAEYMTAPERFGAARYSVGNDTLSQFLSTLPRGERHPAAKASLDYYKFLSTLPRGERQARKGKCRSLVEVSIHAPARGATSFQVCRPVLHVVSIHAPARGATRSSRHL